MFLPFCDWGTKYFFSLGRGQNPQPRKNSAKGRGGYPPFPLTFSVIVTKLAQKRCFGGKKTPFRQRIFLFLSVKGGEGLGVAKILNIGIPKMQPKIVVIVAMGSIRHIELGLKLQNWPFAVHFNFWRL